MTTLVTGFAPFGGMQTNPSRIAGSWLADNRDECVYVPVPTSYSGSVAALVEAVTTRSPDALLLLGFAAGANGLRVERCARNATIDAADNDGCRRPGPITEGGPGRIDTTIDVAAILDVLARNDIRHIASEDAGGYVCNWLYWHALTEHGRLPTLFVHLPEPGSEAEWENLRAGLLLVAEAISRRAASSP
jgi:pyroglutamyl-peptidase